MSLKLPDLKEIAPEFVALNEKQNALRTEESKKALRGSELSKILEKKSFRQK